MLVSVLQSLTTPSIGLAAFPQLGVPWEMIHFCVTSSSALLSLDFCLVVLLYDMVSYNWATPELISPGQRNLRMELRQVAFAFSPDLPPDFGRTGKDIPFE